MTPASALAWLRAHPRTAEALACVLCVALGWVWHRPSAPSITAKSSEAVHQQAAEQHQAQTAATGQQATAASDTKATNEQKRLHVHKVERIAPDGGKVITTDSHYEDDLHVDEAQQVNVVLNFASLAQLAGSSSSDTAATREALVVQAPADRPAWRASALIGFSISGPVYGGEASRRVAGPVWVGAWAISSPAVGIGIGLEW